MKPHNPHSDPFQHNGLFKVFFSVTAHSGTGYDWLIDTGQSPTGLGPLGPAGRECPQGLSGLWRTDAGAASHVDCEFNIVSFLMNLHNKSFRNASPAVT